MDIPQTGGTFIRDPNTGALIRQEDHTAEAAPDAPGLPDKLEQSAEPPAEEPKRKVK